MRTGKVSWLAQDLQPQSLVFFFKKQTKKKHHQSEVFQLKSQAFLIGHYFSLYSLQRLMNHLGGTAF